MAAPGISGGDILQLNVGGESFVVTRGTLTQVLSNALHITCCSTGLYHVAQLCYLIKHNHYEHACEIS